METNHIRELWEKGKEEPKMSKTEIRRLLGRRAHKRSTTFRVAGIWLYTILPAATLVVGTFNMLGYRGNLLMMGIIATIMFVAVGMLVFGVDVAMKHERMERQDADLVTMLQKQLRFYRGRYNAWLLTSALALVLLSLNVNFLVDNQGGYYPFHLSVAFFAFTLLQFGLAYGFLRVAQYAHLKEMKAILSDLERQVTEETEQFDTAFKPKAILWAIVGTVVGTILLILGILAAIGD